MNGNGTNRSGWLVALGLILLSVLLACGCLGSADLGSRAAERVVEIFRQPTAVIVATSEPQAPTQAAAQQTEAQPQLATSQEDPVVFSLKTYFNMSSREELVAFFNMRNLDGSILSGSEVANCPFEWACVRVLREKDANNMIMPFIMDNVTNETFDGWRQAGQGGQSKVPPGTWIVEGVTIRPWTMSPTVVVTSTPAATAATVTPTAEPPEPTTAPTVIPTPTSVGIDWTSREEVYLYFQIEGVSVQDMVPCPEENKCWAIPAREGRTFSFINKSGHQQDGVQEDGTVGFPPGNERVVALGATLRP